MVEAAEEIIRKTCKELDIEVIDKPFFRKESFTKEIIFRSIRSLFYLPCLETLWGAPLKVDTKLRNKKK